ncbi:MAG: rSAM-modified peptide [Clostridia bacterium]|nr:rSAM-modified peptide [Clostridia bacterium]
MKKISLKGVSHVLSEKEMKNVMGGSGECGSDFCLHGALCFTVEGQSGRCIKNYSTSGPPSCDCETY